jgi:hypothetical protein
VFTDDLLLGLRDAAAVRLAGVLEGAVIDPGPWATAPPPLASAGSLLLAVALMLDRYGQQQDGTHVVALGQGVKLLLQDGQLLRLAGAWGRRPQAHHPLSGLEALKLIREHLKARRLADLWRRGRPSIAACSCALSQLSVHVVTRRGARILGRAHHRDVPVGAGDTEMHQHVQGMPTVQRQALEAAGRVVGVDVRVVAEQHLGEDQILLVPVGGEDGALPLGKISTWV